MASASVGGWRTGYNEIFIFDWPVFSRGVILMGKRITFVAFFSRESLRVIEDNSVWE